MDPQTILLIAPLLMLLNGGVLGLMHSALTDDVQPSAVDWRVGTLLAAGGSLLLAVQHSYPLGFILPLGTGCILMAVSLCWRSIRRFDGRPDTALLFAPVVVGCMGIFWFSAVAPSIFGRVLISSSAGMVSLLGAACSLRSGFERHDNISRQVLLIIMLAVAAFMLLRIFYTHQFSAAMSSSIDAGFWVNAATPLVVAILPVIGTTAFLMMCSERVRQQWKIAATTDHLTDLPNRRTVSNAGERCFAAARQAAAQFSVAIIDIDNFKAINDRHGHNVGDQALRHVAELLAQYCHGPNLVGRQGGEEFVVLLPNADAVAALAAAEPMRQAIAATPFRLEDKLLQITVSIGIGALSPADRSLFDLLNRADTALYVAKAHGKNRVHAELPVTLRAALGACG